MWRLCNDLVERLPELGHIDLPRVAISYCQTRKAVRHGVQATLTPLRFAGGSLVGTRHGRRYAMQRMFDPSGREFLYLLSFYLPRFFEQPPREKLVTVLHELWHIGPAFDGDLRRFEGRCYAHSGSQKNYDAAMERLADAWLARRPPPEVHEFLQFTFAELRRLHGEVYGIRYPTPKLLPA